METRKKRAAATAVLAFACLAHGSAMAAGGHHADGVSHRRTSLHRAVTA